MYDLFRDSSFGQILRWVSGKQWAQYAEEQPNFTLPDEYKQPGGYIKRRSTAQSSAVDSELKGSSNDDDKDPEADENGKPDVAPENQKTGDADAEKNERVETEKADDLTIVTWYSDQDPENPHNWGAGKKLWTGFLVLFYTLAVYIGASLYTAGIPAMMELWGLSRLSASVGLSIYVVGYGLGPLIMTPLSEIPWIGRNPSYIIGFALFVILCVPQALVDNFAGMLVLRFLLGVMGSPALATGGASYTDFCTGMQLPYAIAIWAGGASAGPSLGPLIANFAVEAKDWRWPFWELLWLCGPTFVAMFFTLPETSGDKILLRRAQRLRKLTGRDDLLAECEIRARSKRPKEVLFQALIKPWEINIKDPAVLFTTVYLGLVYGIYYSFFESFPMVFAEVYNFGFGELGLVFLSIAVGCLLAVVIWCGFFYFVADKQMEKMKLENVPPEARLAPGLVATFFIPAGLFIFAWTSRESIHWIVCLIGVTLSMLGNFVIAQCVLIYLPFSYPRYAGSLFAANGFSRAMLAAGAILFSIPMFENLGVDWGVSLLAFLCCGCCAGIFLLYFFGANLRKRSKFTGV